MSFSSSWRPAEDETTIINKQTWLVGMILSAVAYGIVFTLFVLTFKELISTTTKQNYAQKLFFLIYISLMLIFGTLYVGSIAKMTERGFIDYRLFPGGPAAFEQQEFSSSIGEIEIVSYVIASWLVDGMLIYRYLVIYRNTRWFPLWVVMSFPVLVYMASFSLGVVWLIQILSPASSAWNTSDGAINFSKVYYWISLFLNVLMTIAICARFLFYRRRITSVLGPNHGTQYTSLVAMLVESASLSSACTLLVFIPFALNNQLQNIFNRLLGEVQIIAALLIIHRMAYGTAWVRETSQTIFGTKEVQNCEGVRVEVEFSGPHERPSNHPSKPQRGQCGEYAMQSLTV